eukprot:RCo008768
MRPPSLNLLRLSVVGLAAILGIQCNKKRLSVVAASSNELTVILETPEFVVMKAAVNAFQMNQYLLGCKRTGEAALVDCGDTESQRWLEAARVRKLDIVHLLQTHAHIDHICGLRVTKELLPRSRVYLHPDDRVWFDSATLQSQMFGLTCEQPEEPDVELREGNVVEVGQLQLTVLHTPGHTPGSVTLWCPQHNLAFTGDVLFRGSIGRVDFPLSDKRAMVASLRRLMALPAQTTVFPGHNEPTTVGEEVQDNPFLQSLKK